MSTRWTQEDVNKLLDKNPHLVPGKKTEVFSKAKYRYYIGIDCGVNTGFAIWDRTEQNFSLVSSVMIHQAMRSVEEWDRLFRTKGVFIRVEDARQANHFRENDIHRLRGAGSIMRDARIWEDFLTALGADFEMVRPRKAVTKLTAEKFKQVTGWDKITNEHARDAGMLVFGF